MKKLSLIIFLLVVGLATTSLAKEKNFKAMLSGSGSVPAVETMAKGDATFTKGAWIMALYTIIGIVAVVALAGGIIDKFSKFVGVILGLSLRSTGETPVRKFIAISQRCFLPAAFVLVCSIPCPTLAAQVQGATVSAAPGTLVRWSAPGTKRCRMDERSWPALQETCYYPIDLLHKPGLIKITRWGHGPGESAHISVEPFAYGTQEIDLGDIPQANPSPKDLKRNARERVMLNKVWKRKETPAKFTLPLGAPAIPLPEGRDFGAKRVFNGKPATQPHTGADYATPAESPVLAVADGTVVVAEDLFFPGNAVFIDHGDGLISMSFHLSEIKVEKGQQVKKGDPIGLVGTTGRSTGPHLFFGIRWHGARINPEFVLKDPANIPAVGP